MEHTRGMERQVERLRLQFIEALDDSAGADGLDEQDNAEEDAPPRPTARLEGGYESPATPEPVSKMVDAQPCKSMAGRTMPARTTSYIPGHEGGEVTISTTLLEHIQVALELSIPLVQRRIGKLKGKVACFSGAVVVDHVLDKGYAATRTSALRLADKLYTSGVLRALQPGGFADAKVSHQKRAL